MSTMAIMDMLVMSKASNGSARGKEYAAVSKGWMCGQTSWTNRWTRAPAHTLEITS